MSEHTPQSIPVELETSAMSQPFPISQTMHQQSENAVYQDSHTPAGGRDHNVLEPEKFGTSPHPVHEIRSDMYPTAVFTGSDKYPTPVMSPAPTIYTPAPQYPVGHYATGQKTLGHFHPPNSVMSPGMLGPASHAHDLENQILGHGGVVSITQKPPKKMTTCCGSMCQLLAFTGMSWSNIRFDSTVHSRNSRCP